ncbi:STAS-like domain-containing protein [Patescibacteria group bacterium]|nr:STAS-like domain-containing protein [Patescibacteria group bacterium]
MKKFGKILNSRPAGREAVLRVRQIINGDADLKEIVIDMSELDVLTPSFADEFYRGVKELYPKKNIKVVGYEDNVVVKDILTSLGILCEK